MTIYNNIASNKCKTVLLIGLFLAVIILFGWVLSYAFDSQVILVIAVSVSVSQALVSYYYSDSITMAISRAREVDRKEAVELHRIVENLAITAGIPKPPIFIIYYSPLSYWRRFLISVLPMPKLF